MRSILWSFILIVFAVGTLLPHHICIDDVPTIGQVKVTAIQSEGSPSVAVKEAIPQIPLHDTHLETVCIHFSIECAPSISIEPHMFDTTYGSTSTGIYISPSLPSFKRPPVSA